MAPAVPHPTPPRDVGAFSLQSRRSRPVAVPVRDADIAVDTGLDVVVVRGSLARLDGTRLVIGSDAGTMSVDAPISEGGAP